MSSASLVAPVRRHSVTPIAMTSPSKKPEPTKASKKHAKAAAPPSASATATTGAKANKSKPAKTDAKKPTANEPTANSKKHSSKQQSFKIAREKERKEKQLKHSSANEHTAVNDTHTTAVVAAQDMEQDSVKSRNHKLFLAPAFHQQRIAPCWSGRLVRDRREDSVAERLHEEILEYTKYTRATVDAMAVHIEQMIAHVDRCVRALWPKSQIEPFGSYSTGIWLPSSDVDLVILGVVEIHDRTLTVKSLRQLANALESQVWVESIVVLETAKIPVLKLVTAESSVPIDITFESTATHSGLLARDLIKRYAEEMPELYPLAVVFKQLLRERDLNDAYTGGLSSYSIVLMIIHFQLLWRYGDKCFKAAAVFASGSPLPRPADLLAEEERQAQELARANDREKAKTAQPESSSPSQPAVVSSFASVVARSKSLKRPVSEAGRGVVGSDGACKPAPAQPFSYAAVAAGIVKLSAQEESAKMAPPPPTSYAAAVAAPAVKTTPGARQAASTRPVQGATKAAASASDVHDAVSVTSSTADTEESSAHGDADDEANHHASDPESQSQPETELSLGERTMTILEFFGIIFDYRVNGLSVRDGGYIYRLADHVGASGDLVKKLPSLVIEDPIHPDRNVSASSFAFSKVVAVFEDSFYALKYFRPSRFTPSALSCLLSTSGHTLHHHHHHSLSAKSPSTSSSSNSSRITIK